MEPTTSAIRQASDEELLAATSTEVPAFEELYRRLVGVTVTFASRRCPTPEGVHDLVAAIWLEVLAARGRYDPSIGRARPWVLGVAANLIADDRRRRAREWEALRRLGGQRVLDHQDDVARVEAQIDANRIAPAVLEALTQLPQGERQAVELVAFEGLSQEEAGTALGLEPPPSGCGFREPVGS